MDEALHVEIGHEAASAHGLEVFLHAADVVLGQRGVGLVRGGSVGIQVLVEDFNVDLVVVVLELLVGKIGQDDQRRGCSRVWEELVVVGYTLAACLAHPLFRLAEELCLVLGTDELDFTLGALSGIMGQHAGVDEFTVFVDGGDIVRRAFLIEQHAVGSGHVVHVLVAKLNDGERLSVALCHGDWQVVSFGSPCSDGHAGDGE